MISFRITDHSAVPNTQIVEILVEGKVAAVIYPRDDSGIKLVSAHFKGVGTSQKFADHVLLNDGTGSNPPIPTISVLFEPSPYTIENGKIVRLTKQ